MLTLNLIPTAVLEVGRWWALVKDQNGDLVWEQQTDGCDAYIEAIGRAKATIDAIEHCQREHTIA